MKRKKNYKKVYRILGKVYYAGSFILMLIFLFMAVVALYDATIYKEQWTHSMLKIGLLCLVTTIIGYWATLKS